MTERELPADLDEQIISQLETERAGIFQFEANIEQRWGYPLGLLHSLTILARRAGADWIRIMCGGDLARLRIDDRTISRLHMRACRTASEIFALLRTGHADGALGRWRTLHELAAVSRLIRKRGERVADRYLDSVAIQRYHGLREYQRHAPSLGLKRTSAEEARAINEHYQEVRRRYDEAGFRMLQERDFGWAHGFVGDANPNLEAIEREVDLHGFRPFYRLANQSIHAPAIGLLSALSDPFRAFPTMAAPSNAGLETPGQLSALHLVYITEALLLPAGSVLLKRRVWELDRSMLDPWQAGYLRIMGNLADTAQNGFTEVAKALRDEEGARLTRPAQAPPSSA
jgi:hypothetical protein